MTDSFISNQELKQRAEKIRLACFDVDGVLTNGQLLFDTHGQELKAFHAHDGFGLKQLLTAGITVAWITARESVIVTTRAQELKIPYVFQGQRDKLNCLLQLCKNLNMSLDQVAYTGDDYPDLSSMQQVGLAIAVANAHERLFDYAHWKTDKRGGEGAVREVCDLLLNAKSKLQE